jgi:LysR family transcriptional regulator, nitrogen assimilation regulatory protein
MDLRSIRYFVQIADLGSITRAADRLGVAQPALTRHVRSLEDELGMQLLLRLPRGVRLTSTGRQFLEHCQRVLREFARVKEELRASNEVPAGRVVLGMSPSIAPLLVPGSVARARRQCPQIALKVVEQFSTTQYDALLTGRVDVGVLTNPTPSRALRLTPLISEPMVVLARPQPRGTRRFFTLTELSQTPIIVSEGMRALVEEQIARYGARLNVEVEIDALDAIRQLVVRGVAVTVMPVSTYHEDIRAGRIAAFQIADANVHRMLFLAHPAERRVSAAVEEISQIVSAETNALYDRGIFGMPAGLQTATKTPRRRQAPSRGKKR